MRIYLILFFLLIPLSSCSLVKSDVDVIDHNESNLFENSNSIKKDYEFYGLASYLNATQTIQVLTNNNETKKNWILQAGRYKAEVWDISKITQKALITELEKSELKNKINDFNIEPEIYYKSELAHLSPSLGQVRFNHLWKLLAKLAIIFEQFLNLIYSLIGSWGWSIILLCIVVKTMFLPLSFLTARIQKNVDSVKSALTPKLKQIKSQYDGEEAHEKIMAAHKELGVGPFYTLKPLLFTFIQIPVLIAVFNALGEMHQLSGSSFLWIENLAYPDQKITLPFAAPLIGEKIHFLPILMLIINLGVAFTYKNSSYSEQEIKKQKRSLYLMAFVYFILFYPFPAAMVLYWLVTCLIEFFQRKCFYK